MEGVSTRTEVSHGGGGVSVLGQKCHMGGSVLGQKCHMGEGGSTRTG